MNAQEDTNRIGATISHWNISQVPHLRNETLGGEFRLTYISQEVRRIIEPIIRTLSETKSPDVVKEVQELIPMVIEIVLELSKSNFDLSNLQPLNATNLEDGSFLIEWIFPNYRVGFVIERDPKESIWYLVSKSESSDSNLSGNLDIHDKKALLTRLVSHVALNS